MSCLYNLMCCTRSYRYVNNTHRAKDQRSEPLDDFNNSNQENASKYSLSECETAKQFVPPIYEGIVVKVYDGDTITIVSRLPYEDSPYYKFSIRLAGIDTPEIKGKSEQEKIKAVQARDALATLILNKCVILKNIQTEKYGRILADVYLDDLHLNKWLIEQGHAVPYNGGTKGTWVQDATKGGSE